jgi:hypothetical protein
MTPLTSFTIPKVSRCHEEEEEQKGSGGRTEVSRFSPLIVHMLALWEENILSVRVWHILCLLLVRLYYNN